MKRLIPIIVLTLFLGGCQKTNEPVKSGGYTVTITNSTNINIKNIRYKGEFDSSDTQTNGNKIITPSEVVELNIKSPSIELAIIYETNNTIYSGSINIDKDTKIYIEQDINNELTFSVR